MRFRVQPGLSAWLALSLSLAVAGVLNAAAPPLVLPVIMNSARPSTPPPSGQPVNFALGPGHADLTAHQVVRAANDRVYVVAGRMGSNIVTLYASTIALPISVANFASVTMTTVDGRDVMMVTTAYSTQNTTLIPVFVQTTGGALYLHVFDTGSNTFRAGLQVATGLPVFRDDDLYLGTVGSSVVADSTGRFHAAYWTGTQATNQPTFNAAIQYCSFTYNAAANTFSGCSPTAVTTSTGVNTHPVLAVAPNDGSVTVAWLQGFDSSAQIVARTKPAGGGFGSLQVVSTQMPWTGRSTGNLPQNRHYNEIDVDQGPGLVIDNSGTRHLVYIADEESIPGTQAIDYGRIVYAAQASGASTWSATALPNFSHDPAVYVAPNGEVLILGHGWDKSGASAVPECRTGRSMCYMRKPPGGAWSQQLLVANFVGDQSYDGSSSVKWSPSGMQRPELFEFAFYSIRESTGQYQNPTVHYGRIAAP
jgi:hypothetical protein